MNLSPSKKRPRGSANDTQPNEWWRAFAIIATEAEGNDDPDDRPPEEWCVTCGAPQSKARTGGGRVVCVCGTVMEHEIDDRPEWSTRQETRMYGTDPSRGEAINPLMPHASMNTEIEQIGRLPYHQYKMIKLNRWQTLSPVERSLCAVFSKLEKACSRYRVPSGVQYTTKWLFKRVYEENLEKQRNGGKREGLRGPKRDGLIAACLYYAFKAHQLYWTKANVAAVMSIPPSDLRRGKSIFWALLKDKPLPKSLKTITSCKHYIACYAVELHLPKYMATFAQSLYQELKRFGIGASKQPQSVAAGCLFSVCNVLRPSVTDDVIAATTGISKGTIKEVVRIGRSGGAEQVALLTIFVEELCDLCNVRNQLTRFKSVEVAKCFFRMGLHDSFGLWHLSGYAIYFIFVINDIALEEQKLKRACGLGSNMILDITKRVIPFRDAIIRECFGIRDGIK